MRQELSKWGIKAVAIHPSGFRTGWCLTFRDVLSASRPCSSAVSNRALSDSQESDILSHSLCGLWKLSSVFFFFFCERCSLQLYTLPASPLLGRAIFALRQGGFQAVAPALLELTNGAAWWVQFECYGPLVLPGSFRCPRHSSLAQYQSSLYWAALSCMAVAAAIPAILLAVNILWSFLSTPSPWAPAAFCPKFSSSFNRASPGSRFISCCTCPHSTLCLPRAFFLWLCKSNWSFP